MKIWDGKYYLHGFQQLCRYEKAIKSYANAQLVRKYLPKQTVRFEMRCNTKRIADVRSSSDIHSELRDSNTIVGIAQPLKNEKKKILEKLYCNVDLCFFKLRRFDEAMMCFYKCKVILQTIGKNDKR